MLDSRWILVFPRKSHLNLEPCRCVSEKLTWTCAPGTLYLEMLLYAISTAPSTFKIHFIFDDFWECVVSAYFTKMAWSIRAIPRKYKLNWKPCRCVSEELLWTCTASQAVSENVTSQFQLHSDSFQFQKHLPKGEQFWAWILWFFFVFLPVLNFGLHECWSCLKAKGCGRC